MLSSGIKKFFVITFTVLFLGCAPSFCEGVSNSQLMKIENEIWGFSHENEDDITRLERIEKQIFGATSPNLEQQKRLEKITKSMGLETEEEEKKSAVDIYIPEKAGQGAEYPIVDSLETAILGNTYKTDNIDKRIERLEKEAFGTVQTGDLSQRTDNLKRYAGKEAIGQTAQTPQYNSYEPAFNPESDETKLQLSALENLMYGTDYSQEPVATRLTRLENKIFQRNFANDDLTMRIQRIQAAATAGKTAKYYDSNKFNKFTSTGMQLGTFLLMLLAFIL